MAKKAGGAQMIWHILDILLAGNMNNQLFRYFELKEATINTIQVITTVQLIAKMVAKHAHIFWVSFFGKSHDILVDNNAIPFDNIWVLTS